LLEAHNRGFWNPDEEILESLRDILSSTAGEQHRPMESVV